MAKLFVGSLSYDVTDDGLLQLFTDKGYRPLSARVITDKFSGQSRGFGFVELGPDDNMAQAIGQLNGLNIGGRAIQVNEAREQESRGGGGRRFGGGGGRGGFSGGRSGRGGHRDF